MGSCVLPSCVALLPLSSVLSWEYSRRKPSFPTDSTLHQSLEWASPWAPPAL